MASPAHPNPEIIAKLAKAGLIPAAAGAPRVPAYLGSSSASRRLADAAHALNFPITRTR
jgi:hypothetical protein